MRQQQQAHVCAGQWGCGIAPLSMCQLSANGWCRFDHYLFASVCVCRDLCYLTCRVHSCSADAAAWGSTGGGTRC